MDPLSIGVIGASVLASLAIASWAALKGWSAWLELKRLEISHVGHDRVAPQTGGRIEIADLRERVRKLEAIAAGIEL